MPFSAIVGAISSLLNHHSQKQTNEQNMKIAQFNNEFSEKMLDKQIAFNKSMWNAENEYNTPAQQARRLREAGLNPALIMGSGNTGTAGSVGGINTPTASPVQMNAPQYDSTPLQTGIQAYQQNKLANRIADQDIALKQQQIQQSKEQLQLENRKVFADMIDKISTSNLKDKQAVYQQLINNWFERDKQQQAERHVADVEQIKATTLREEAQSTSIFLQGLLTYKQLQHFDQQQQIVVSEALSRIALNYAEKKKKGQETENLKETKKQILEATKGLGLDNKQKEAVEQYVIERYRLDSLPRTPYEEMSNPNKPWWYIIPEIGHTIQSISPLKLGK